jgi:DNA-binding CsgD family transcriptional regulator
MDSEDSDESLFWQIVDEHPLCVHHTRTGQLDPIKLSDFGTRAELRRLSIWDSWFGAIGIVDEIEVGIWPSRRFTKTFILDRSGRDYTERDRDILAVLRPHLAALYQRALERRRAAAVLTAFEQTPGRGVIILDPADRIELATAQAWMLLERYIGGAVGDRLPQPIVDWVTTLRTTPRKVTTLPTSAEPLDLEGSQGRLRIQLIDDVTLLVAERPNSASADLLTRREHEILELVAQGKSNAEIAETLWVTPATVRKHLEHVYGKLNVGSRTAAVARVFTKSHSL